MSDSVGAEMPSGNRPGIINRYREDRPFLASLAAQREARKTAAATSSKQQTDAAAFIAPPPQMSVEAAVPTEAEAAPSEDVLVNTFLLTPEELIELKSSLSTMTLSNLKDTFEFFHKIDIQLDEKLNKMGSNKTNSNEYKNIKGKLAQNAELKKLINDYIQKHPGNEDRDSAIFEKFLTHSYATRETTRELTEEESLEHFNKIIDNRDSSLKHAVYIEGTVGEHQELYEASGEENILTFHDEIKNMKMQDYLVNQVVATATPVPTSNQLRESIMSLNCCLNTGEFSNDNLVEETETNENNNPQGGGGGGKKKQQQAAKKAAARVLRQEAEAIGGVDTCRMGLLEKFIWLKNMLTKKYNGVSPYDDKPQIKMRYIIEAVLFNQDFKFNPRNKLVEQYECPNDGVGDEGVTKNAKILFAQPKYRVSMEADMKPTNSIPWAIKETYTKFNRERANDININKGVIHRWVTARSEQSYIDNDGLTEATPTYYEKYYYSESVKGLMVLFAASLLKVLLVAYAGSIDHYGQDPETDEYYYYIVYSLNAEQLNVEFNLERERDSVFHNYMKLKESFGEEPIDTIRTDIVCLLTQEEYFKDDRGNIVLENGKKKISNYFHILSLKPALMGLNVIITKISTILNIDLNSYNEGLTISHITSTFDSAHVSHYKETYETMDERKCVLVDIKTPKEYIRKRDGKINKSDKNETEVFIAQNDALQKLKTNNHTHFGIMSHLVYLTTDIVKQYFKHTDIKYLKEFDPDPDWVVNGIAIKHRIHTWYKLERSPIKGTANKISVYIAVRGSHTTRDWHLADFSITWGTAPFFDERVAQIPNLIKQIQTALVEKIRIQYISDVTRGAGIPALVEKNKFSVNMYSTGHSLGGFLALMFAYKSLTGVASEILSLNVGTTKFAFNQYIYPVGFNPFIGIHDKCKDAIKLIPYGYAYRIYSTGNESGGAETLARASTNIAGNYLDLGDTASCALDDPSDYRININQFLNHHYKTYWYNSGLISKLGIPGFMTHAHIMMQFIGVYWAHINKQNTDNTVKISHIKYEAFGKKLGTLARSLGVYKDIFNRADALDKKRFYEQLSTHISPAEEYNLRDITALAQYVDPHVGGSNDPTNNTPEESVPSAPKRQNGNKENRENSIKIPSSPLDGENSENSIEIPSSPLDSENSSETTLPTFPLELLSLMKEENYVIPLDSKISPRGYTKEIYVTDVFGRILYPMDFTYEIKEHEGKSYMVYLNNTYNNDLNDPNDPAIRKQAQKMGGAQHKSTRAKKRYNAKTRRGRRNQRR